MAGQRILVVDDDKEVVRLTRAYLEQAGFDVLVAYDGETAVHVLRTEKLDLVLLDLMLPDRDGWDITRLIRNDPRLVDIPIIMLTARVEVTERIVGLEIGADDYVTKPFDPREVVARVRAQLRKPETFAARSLGAGALTMDLDRREVQVDGHPVELTPSEFSLLKALMEHPGYVFTRSELVRKGLGSDYEGLERTLDSHIRNLRQKIEPDPKDPMYIQTVYGVGYRLEAELR
jgi:two-component system alkaline phosphatase synthesis response regulator PhoP